MNGDASQKLRNYLSKEWSAVGLVLAPTPQAALSSVVSVAVVLAEALVAVVGFLVGDESLPLFRVAESVDAHVSSLDRDEDGQEDQADDAGELHFGLFKFYTWDK